jgi:hypothetical protein
MNLKMVSVKDTCATPKCGFKVKQIVEGTKEVKCLDCKSTIQIKRTA